MKIIRSEKENTHYFINYFDSLYSGFGFYVNDYYHAQTDALEILKHQEVKRMVFLPVEHYSNVMLKGKDVQSLQVNHSYYQR